MERRMMALWTSVLCVSLLMVAPAKAETTPTERTFALVLANNRSVSESLPDLQYADDDGARYYRIFRTIAADEDLALLTVFDRASKAEYPAMAALARPPSSAELFAARDRLAEAIDAAHAAGQRTSLYVVYAGHGEMQNGRGVLDLEDAQIDGAFIERELLDTLHADTKHLVLDSCNSFFVMNPRSPGGRRWATPKDMAFGFSARHPEVGLFLSTNSESEVFEWSELESGVFSHEVRSGISGGADVDGDGMVSYVELAGFIETANAGMARESMRPHLYYRGPHGNAAAPLFATAQMRGRKVVLFADEARFWIKGETGERLIDAHKDKGPMTLVIPAEAAVGDLSVFVQHGDAHPTVSEHVVLDGSDPIDLRAEAGQTPRLAQRGSRMFGALFSKPYGPVALAAYQEAESSGDEPVFGLADSDLTRMHHYLTEFAQAGKSRRSRAAVSTFAAASIGLGALLGTAIRPDVGDRLQPLLGTSIITATAMTAGLVLALRPSSGERALRTFENEMAQGPARGKRAFVETEKWVARLVDRERRVRKTVFWASEIYASALIAGGSVVLALPAHGQKELHERAINGAMFYSGALGLAVLGIAVRLIDTPTERLLKLYREDPGLHLHLTGGVSKSAATVGVAGRF